MTAEPERIIGLYRQHAKAWARDRGVVLREKDWLDRFLTPLGHAPTILDLGCGSGDPIARYLIEKGCQVTGVDTSAELLAMCREKFPAQRWVEADMRTLSLGARFDGILAWDSFFHLPHDDQRKMFAVFREHADPQSRLLFTSGTEHGVAMGEYGGEPLYHASLDTAEYRELLGAHGFEVIAHVVADVSCRDHTVWLARNVVCES